MSILDITTRDSIFEAYQKGSFRGEPFLYTDSDGDLGRRAVVHEYPGRDLPFVEDMGRRTRTWSMELMVAGPDYMALRNRMIEALEKAGPGELIHPTLGKLNVCVVDARGPRESTRQGGTARFYVTFVESGGAAYPSYQASPAAKTVRLADAVDALAAAQLEKRLNLEGPGFIAEDAISRLVDFSETVRRTLTRLPEIAASSEIMQKLTDLSTGSSTLIYAPIDLYGSITTIFSDVQTAVENPLRAYSALRDFRGYSGAGETVPLTTASRMVQDENRTQLDLAFNLAAASAAARAASAAIYDSQNAADGAKDEILAWLDDESLIADPSLYEALMDFRAGIFKDLGNRPGLPRVLAMRLTEETPALVLAHRLYGDAERADDIVARNKIPHPGFVPSGLDLEVLDV
jgi:prophage DNA circulation protein